MATKKTAKVTKPRRAVIIAGKRTPFVRAFTSLTKVDTIGLGAAAVRGLLEDTDLPYREVEALVWGGVILPSASPNVGREIALEIGLPPSAEAMTVTRACASGLQAITLAVAAIERGEYDVAIAGGSDSTSNAELMMPQKLVHTVAPVAMSSKSGPKDWLGVAAQLRPGMLMPKQPKIVERSTGQLMGEAAEEMAGRNAISREDQDALAAESHHRAAAAKAFLAKEITPVGDVTEDGMVRGDTSAEKLARLRPVFAKNGTLTAGNSSGLTDGGAAVLLMSEEKALELGYTPLAAFKSWSYVGVDPADQLLIGPAIAMPKALERAGLELSDIDLVDMHEAFAAQVLSVLKVMSSESFAKERLGRDQGVGEVDRERFNIYGGSIALGHPFAATGARMVTTMANALHREDKQTALLGICAAGGLGAAAVLERV